MSDVPGDAKRSDLAQREDQAKRGDHDPRIESSIAAIRAVLEQIHDASPREQEALAQERDRLEQMIEKLTAGRIEIAVFGQVNVGKSSLINALVGEAVAETSARAGSTVESTRFGWGGVAYTVKGLENSEVVLIDTPGLNEVSGEERARMAREVASRCELILFVVADDLLDVQYQELRRLGEAGRPIILVFNKSDLREPEELKALLDHIRGERLPRFMQPEDVVAVAASPRPVAYVIEKPDGSVVEESRRPAPRIDALKVRIVEILEREGRALLVINSAIFAADSSDKLSALKARLRRQAADRLILRFAAAKAAAVAVNPLPVVDVAGGALVDAKMIHSLAGLYGVELTKGRVQELLTSIAVSAGWVTAGELITHAAATLLKAGTFGLSTLLTAPVQGLAAGYGSYVVGQAARYWVEHGQGWGKDGPKTVVKRILKEAREGTAINALRAEIERQLKANRHAG